MLQLERQVQWEHSAGDLIWSSPEEDLPQQELLKLSFEKYVEWILPYVQCKILHI
jgi:hypothetical protein